MGHYEHTNIGTHWVPFYVKNDEMTSFFLFISFGV